jgi:hypothetical protein
VKQLRPEHLPDGMLSIAVFGPGKGEAIVVRLPDGSVGVVDGCREPRDDGGRGDPVRELVDAFARVSRIPDAFRLSFVCLTHPHDDHYAGLGRLLEAYAGRIDEVWSVLHTTPRYAQALHEWLAATRGGEISLPDDANPRGLARVIEQLHAAHQKYGSAPYNVGAGQLLRSASLRGHQFVAMACGPSHKDLIDATDELLFLLQQKAEGLEPRIEHDPNRTSGAILLRWGDAAILLTGDLLCGADPRSGWLAARKYVTHQVQVVNVSHHASVEAHDATLWEIMKPRLAIVTPFKMAAGNQPPRPDQIAAIASTSVVAITSPPAWPGGTLESARPMDAHSRSRRSVKPKNSVLSLEPTRAHGDISNAIAVSLDPTGRIVSFVLAGEADVYLAADE